MTADREQKLIRTVGLGGLVAMCINAVVGSGVFLLPSESYKLLGPFSLWAPLIIAILIHAVAALVLALGGSFAQLAMLSAVARLTTYLFTCAAVPRLRKLNEGFRTPGLVVPLLGTLISLALFLTLNTRNLVAAVTALTIGAIVFAVTKPHAIAVTE